MSFSVIKNQQNCMYRQHVPSEINSRPWNPRWHKGVNNEPLLRTFGWQADKFTFETYHEGSLLLFV
jgi:hypothetical protein